MSFNFGWHKNVHVLVDLLSPVLAFGAIRTLSSCPTADIHDSCTDSKRLSDFRLSSA